MKKFFAVLPLFLSLSVAVAATPAAKPCRATQITGWNFDWDDNIFNMPTRIVLKDTKSGEEKRVTTAEWAVIREKVGHPGSWEHYRFDPDVKFGSLRYFGDNMGDGVNYFKQDVEKALQEPPAVWQAPSWNAFREAMLRRRSSEWTTIITARQHAPETIHAALEFLHGKGYLKHLPPLANIYPVSYPKFDPALRGDGQNPSEAKAKVMMRILDRMQARPLGADARKVLDPDAMTKKPLHLWGFSDDDYGNYAKAVNALGSVLRAEPQRWNHIKITLFFTGKNHPTERARVEVLKSNGEVRPAKLDELKEATAILKSAPKECQI